MQNPVITNAKMKARACEYGQRRFAKLFGRNAHITLSAAFERLIRLPQLTPSLVEDIIWGVETFGNPTKTEIKKMVQSINPYGLAPSKAAKLAYALYALQGGNYYTALNRALQADARACVRRLFPNLQGG